MQSGPNVLRSDAMTVVLVDDEPLARFALAEALTAQGLTVVCEATNTQDAINVVVDLRPDVVLMDISVPGQSASEAIEHLDLLAPSSRILILTNTEHNRVVEAIVAGASGYILKSAPLDEI